MTDKRRNSRSKPNDKQQDDNTAPPPRLKPQQWMLLGAGALGVGAAFFRWSANARREQQRRQQLSAADQRELAMISLPTRSKPRTETTDVAVVSAPPVLETPAAPKAGFSAVLPVLPSPASSSSAADVADTAPSNAPAPDTMQAGAALPGTVATRKRKVAGAATTQTTETTDAGSKSSKTTRTASKSEMPSASAAATGKKKMSNTTGKRSKMSEEFDQALEENTVEGPGSGGSAAQTAVANVSAGASSPAAPGVPSAAPAENALATQAEGKLAVGEELRDREFPVPPQDTGAISQRLVVDQETLSDETPRMGGAIGTMPGDRQPNGDINDIVDQRAVTPDLQAQKG